MLPGSTEVSCRLTVTVYSQLIRLCTVQRILSVVGVADAIHIAVYYIGTVLLEYQDRTGVKDSMYNQRGTQDRSPIHNSMPPVGPDAAVQQFWIPNDLVGSSEYFRASRVG